MAATPVRNLARWRRRRGELSQLPKAEVVLAASLAQNGAGFSLPLHNNKQIATISTHAVLGGDGPRWQPLNGAGRHARLMARRQLESVLAGGKGDGGIQLRRDDDGAHPSAGKRMVVATAERTGFGSDGFQIRLFAYHIRPYRMFGLLSFCLFYTFGLFVIFRAS